MTRSILPAHDLDNTEGLLDALVDLHAAGEPDGLLPLLGEMGAPTTDLCVTALTARAAIMGAQTGRAFYHHELRRRLPMPPELEPEIAVWEAGTTPVWTDGVLAEPKYFSFFQDGPFPAFNPNHRRKWRAHELLHGASRWFWHPEMTRFEFYVSARLNELLPVVHWYHFDEIFRPRCPAHEDQVLHREHCLACEAAARPYWECDAPTQPHRREAARRLLAAGLTHFQEEWEASALEIQTGRAVPTPRPRLDASSDAMGYLRAHWNRVTAWSFGSWVETYLIDGVDYFSTLGALHTHIRGRLEGLFGGELAITVPEYRARRARAQLQDVAYRVYLALEWLDPETEAGRQAENTLQPFLEEGGELAASVMVDPSLTDRALSHCALICERFSFLAHLFPEEIADGFLGLGYRFLDRDVFVTAGAGQIFSGLEDGLPATMEALEDPLQAVLDFGRSPHFDDHGRLAGRFSHWLESTTPNLPPRVDEIAAFEAWINAEPRTDSEAIHFAALPHHASDVKNRPGLLRPHETLRRGQFSPTVLREITGQAFSAEPHGTGKVALAAAIVSGEPRLLAEDEATGLVLDHVLSGASPNDWWDFSLAQALLELLEEGLLVWLPAPVPPSTERQ